MKNIKNQIIFAILLMSFGFIKAQQDPMFTQYMFNTLSLNPAYAGSSNLISATAITRHQWIGIKGAPQTQTVAIHSPLKFQLGAGLSIIRDQAGPVNNLSAQGNISYNINLTQNSKLYFGLMGGITNFRVGLTGLDNLNNEDISFHQNINSYLPVFGFGLYYRNPNAYIGISAPNLIENKTINAPTDLVHKRHYFLIAGFVKDISNDFKLRPTMMLRYVQNAPISAEFTASVILKDMFWIGAMYRIKDAAGALFCIQINQNFRIGYSYDYSLNKLRGSQSGSHELMINYDFSFKSTKYVSPRYF